MEGEGRGRPAPASERRRDAGSLVSASFDSTRPSKIEPRESADLVARAAKVFDNEATLQPLTANIRRWAAQVSVIRMLNEVAGKGRYVPWFNAWRHHQEEQLGPALLQNIVREFRRQAGPRVRLRSLTSAILRSRRTWYWFAAAFAFVISSVGSYWISHDRRALLGLLGSVVPFWKAAFTPFVRLFAVEPADARQVLQRAHRFLQEFSEESNVSVGALRRTTT